MHAHGTGVRLLASVSLVYNQYLVFVKLTKRAGSSLGSQLKKAIPKRDHHQGNHQKFSETFPKETTDKWEKLILDWDEDMMKPNPYAEPVVGEISFLKQLLPVY